jgi:hypothetical protein
MATGDVEPLRGSRADRGGIVGGPGAQTGARFDEVELDDAGQELVRGAKEVVHGPGGSPRVETLFLDRRANNHASVGARHDVSVETADVAGGDGFGRVAAQL